MTNDQSVIGLAHEIARWQTKYGTPMSNVPRLEVSVGELLSLAQALLDRDAALKSIARDHDALMNKCDALQGKLKIAIEALEKVASDEEEGSRYVREALARISSFSSL